MLHPGDSFRRLVLCCSAWLCHPCLLFFKQSNTHAPQTFVKRLRALGSVKIYGCRHLAETKTKLWKPSSLLQYIIKENGEGGQNLSL
jgi:hypothetical protein